MKDGHHRRAVPTLITALQASDLLHIPPDQVPVYVTAWAQLMGRGSAKLYRLVDVLAVARERGVT